MIGSTPVHNHREDKINPLMCSDSSLSAHIRNVLSDESCQVFNSQWLPKPPDGGPFGDNMLNKIPVSLF